MEILISQPVLERGFQRDTWNIYKHYETSNNNCVNKSSMLTLYSVLKIMESTGNFRNGTYNLFCIFITFFHGRIPLDWNNGRESFSSSFCEAIKLTVLVLSKLYNAVTSHCNTTLTKWLKRVKFKGFQGIIYLEKHNLLARK